MIKDAFDLKRKTAIVTGAGRGLGRAMAEALSEAGAAVVIADKREQNIDETVKLIKSSGGKAIGIRCDVSNSESVKAMVEQTIQDLDHIDILVNNAGIARRIPLLEMTEENWNKMLSVNLTGLFNCCRAVGLHMVSQRYGKIINIASTSGIEGEKGYTCYTATKAGVILFTKSLALEWAQHNINVNAIGPGWFHTPMTDPLTKDPVRFEEIMRCIPKGRFAKPKEIGPLVVFLASEASDFMTGSITIMDGGQLAGVWS
ncbi:SDR family NAD(P)-dependent oxidoreductase [Thermodesulfobacteriota bacterium]